MTDAKVPSKPESKKTEPQTDEPQTNEPQAIEPQSSEIAGETFEPGETAIVQPTYGEVDEDGYTGVSPVPVRSSHVDRP